MSTCSLVIDQQLRYFEATVPAVNHARRSGVIEVVDTHYAGIFATATLYKPLGERSLEQVRQLFGCDALSPIRAGQRAVAA